MFPCVGGVYTHNHTRYISSNIFYGDVAEAV